MITIQNLHPLCQPILRHLIPHVKITVSVSAIFACCCEMLHPFPVGLRGVEVSSGQNESSSFWAARGILTWLTWHPDMASVALPSVAAASLLSA